MMYNEGDIFTDGKGDILVIDYVGPNAYNYHFGNENPGKHQATFTQFSSVLEGNGFVKSAYTNPRDEYLKMVGRNNRENNLTLSVGDLDEALENNGYFIKGFWKWSSDSHNYAAQIDIDLYLVIKYATDGGGVTAEIIDTSDGTRKQVASAHTPFYGYDEVVSTCIEAAEQVNEDVTEFFE